MSHHLGVYGLRETIDAAADLLLGARCPGCLSASVDVCADCLGEVALGRAAATYRMVSPPLPMWSAGGYHGCRKRLLTAYKERGRQSLAPLLAGELARAVAGLVIAAGIVDPVALVPVPSRPDAVRRRSYDAVADLAAGAAVLLRRTGVEATARCLLRHRRQVADQSGLSQDQRARNLAGALSADRLDGALIVVVDDIVTTGASLAESARALRSAGCCVIGAATVAATVLRR